MLAADHPPAARSHQRAQQRAREGLVRIERVERLTVACQMLRCGRPTAIPAVPGAWSPGHTLWVGQSRSEPRGARNARLGDPYGPVVVVVLDVVVVVGTVGIVVELVVVVLVVAVLEVVVDVAVVEVVVPGFFCDGTQNSFREITLTSRWPNWFSIECTASPKRCDLVL